jgi:hypothetical protein
MMWWIDKLVPSGIRNGRYRHHDTITIVHVNSTFSALHNGPFARHLPGDRDHGHTMLKGRYGDTGSVILTPAPQ